MKSSLAILVVAASLLEGLPSTSLAQAPAPVLQQVQVPVNRARVPNSGTGAVFVRYILVDPGNADPVRDGFAPLERAAVLVLFIGGDGTLNLGAGQVNTGSPNPVARNRYHFAAQGYVVAVVDAANDFNNTATGLRGRRLGSEHLADLRAVLRDLRTKYQDLPIWAVGHSRGTLSAGVMAAMAAEVTPEAVFPPADGLVLLSSLTGDPANPSEDLSRVDLESIRAPVLIASHRGDLCSFTNPDDARALRERFVVSERTKFRLFEGGSEPVSNACDPLAPHGFFGIDQKVVDATTRWISRREDEERE